MCDLIPMIGATLGAVICVLAALLTTELWPTTVVVAIFFVAYQQLENYFLAPRILHSKQSGCLDSSYCSTGSRFADLYRAWSVSLFFEGFSPSTAKRRPADGSNLAGPRTFSVNPGDPETAWSLAGTASRYLIVGPNPGGATELSVYAPAEAELQLTAVPLPDDLAEIEMTVGAAVNVSKGDPCFRVNLSEERDAPPGSHPSRGNLSSPVPTLTRPDSAARVDAPGIAASFGAWSLPGHGRL